MRQGCKIVNLGESTAIICGGEPADHKCNEDAVVYETNENHFFYKNKKRANTINLSMPESVEYYEFKLEKAKEYHAGMKSGQYERGHSFSLTYAKKEVNEIEKKLDLAKRLWE